MTLTDVYARQRLGRVVHGMAAVLLPFQADGSIAEDAYAGLFRETLAAGLTPAVNMDTGYVQLLTPAERSRVLSIAESVAGGANFLAGAYVEGASGDLVDLYRREMAQIAEHGGTPILFQTSRLHGCPGVVDVYRRAARGFPRVYAFELGQMFAPSGEIWPQEVVRGLMDVPEIVGMKHSSLDRLVELGRLSLRNEHRPEFQILTGNDLGIDMTEYGSDYLLGLATFCPAKFAERDRLWAAGDPDYWALSDALQYLGNVAFQAPVPAYRHAAAIFLHMTGKIPTDLPHLGAPTRPEWIRDALRDCATRLGLL
jgi:4-hydroxy-tetrahydrodipicolinate synthase